MQKVPGTVLEAEGQQLLRHSILTQSRNLKPRPESTPVYKEGCNIHCVGMRCGDIYLKLLYFESE